jgi:hypothetical protein
MGAEGWGILKRDERAERSLVCRRNDLIQQLKSFNYSKALDR